MLVSLTLSLNHLILILNVSFDAILFLFTSPPLLVSLSIALMLLEELFLDLGKIMQ